LKGKGKGKGKNCEEITTCLFRDPTKPKINEPKKKLKKSKLNQDRWVTKFVWFKLIYGGWQEEDGEVQNLFQS
jgi:hypothetical protein